MTIVVHTGVVVGVQGQLIQVEANLRPGIPYFDLVGLAGSTVKEARIRVEQAVRSSGLEWPRKRIVLNLAPAELRKEGSGLDLSLAVACLAESKQLPKERLASSIFLGELSLDAQLRPVRGVLPVIEAARQLGLRYAVVPAANAREAALVPGMVIVPAPDLATALAWLEHGQVKALPEPTQTTQSSLGSDWGELRGQDQAKRAAEIALAGGHNLLLTGPPGTGKTLLARALPALLPPLDGDELLDVLRVRSVVQGEVSLDQPQRPFRAPHHSISAAGLIGGGRPLSPGEVTIAHGGVLFLDELPEFPRRALECLRQPLEDGFLTITRAGCRVTFPARVMIVAACNPCPCGYFGSQARGCVCTPTAVQRYQARLSGPMLERIDLQVRMDRPAADLLLATDAANQETSEQVACRIRQARRFAVERQGCLNARLHKQLIKVVRPEASTLDLLRSASDRLSLSPRLTTRLIKVARSIADLAGNETVSPKHLAEAFSLRLSAKEAAS